MYRNYYRRLVSLTLMFGCLMGSLLIPRGVVNGQLQSNAPKNVPADAKSAASEKIKQLSQRPLSFEANQGQTDARVKFLSRGSGYNLFLTPTEAVLSLLKDKNQNPSVVRMQLAGANATPEVVGQNELPGKINYFQGGNGNVTRNNVSTYARVHYDEVYPGIDMVYYGKQQQLEYDFIVDPQRDPNTIRLNFSGVKRLSIDKAGDLVLDTAGGQLKQQRPIAYQEIDGRRQPVAASYVLRNRRQVGFELGEYDETKPLVIDPVIHYSTYLGGGNQEEGNDIAIDPDGYIYVTGWTASVNFPPRDAIKPTCLSCQNWSYDAFVTKINPWASGDLSLVYSTFWGHSAGGGMSEGRAIAIDSERNIIVGGVTTSNIFPTTPNSLQPVFQMFSGSNGFVTKFNATGSMMLYSTYLQGNNVDAVADIAVDSHDNLYVAGATASTNFRVEPGAYQGYNMGGFDGFVMKFEPLDLTSYELKYSTYFGGVSTDMASNLAVDRNGHVYLTGSTQSADWPGTPWYEGFPVLNGFQTALSAGTDAFMTKFDPTLSGNASLLYSTYLGGTGQENAAVQLGGIAVEDSEKPQVYVTGTTGSNNLSFPLMAAGDNSLAGYDVFVTRIDTLQAGINSLIFSTYLGGLGLDYGNDIALNAQGLLFITGMTQSNDFPVVECGAPDGPSWDGFITVMNTSGVVLYSSYLAANNYDLINAIAVDPSGSTAYVTGSTDSSNFDKTNGFQQNLGGSSPGSYFKDAFVTKITLGCTP